MRKQFPFLFDSQTLRSRQIIYSLHLYTVKIQDEV
jgi:hypothetical protein